MTKKDTQPTRYALVILLGTMMAMGPLAMAMYLSAIPTIAKLMQADIDLIQQSLTVYLLGFAGSQLIFGPVSETTGRRPIILCALILYIVSSLLCSYANSAQQLINFRFTQGLSSGAISAMVLLVLNDRYVGNQVIRNYSLAFSVMTLATISSPSIGALVIQMASWQTIFQLLAAVGVIVLAMTSIYLPESLHKSQRQRLNLKRLAQNYRTVLNHRHAMGNILSGSFAYAYLFAFISGSVFLYMEHYQLSAGLYTLLLAIINTMQVIFSWINVRITGRYRPDQIVVFATTQITLASMVILLLISSRADSVIVVTAIFAYSIGMIALIAGNTAPAAIAPFIHEAGTAAGLYGGGRFIISSFAAGGVGLLQNGSPLPMMAIMVACGVLSFATYRYLGGTATSNN
jgi:DHA1 family bicyclomycin/chloramphenicol resistance-like MFS transporter|tara:strand:+ start:13358 stop:14563 length:1206 start_codon:yes stop_codon:yes gene_type:complete